MKKSQLPLTTLMILLVVPNLTFANVTEDALSTVRQNRGAAVTGGITGPNSVPSPLDIQTSKQAAQDKVLNVLKNIEAGQIPGGFTSPLRYMLSVAEEVKSQAAPIETAARFTFATMLDVINSTIANSGANEDMLSAVYTNIMKSSFVLAGGYLNAPGCQNNTNGNANLTSSYVKCSLAVPNHLVAVNLALLLWKNSATLISGTAEGVLLMNVVQVLKLGINDSDLRTQHAAQQLYKELEQIEGRGTAYQNVASSISRYLEPNQADIGDLRAAVKLVLDKLPSVMTTK